MQMASPCYILFFQTEGNEKKSETNKYPQARFARPWRKWSSTSVALLAIRRTSLILCNTPKKGFSKEKGKEGSWQALKRDVSSRFLKDRLCAPSWINEVQAPALRRRYKIKDFSGNMCLLLFPFAQASEAPCRFLKGTSKGFGHQESERWGDAAPRAGSSSLGTVLSSELPITPYVISATRLPQFVLHNTTSTNYHWLFLGNGSF